MFKIGEIVFCELDKKNYEIISIVDKDYVFAIKVGKNKDKDRDLIHTSWLVHSNIIDYENNFQLIYE